MPKPLALVFAGLLLVALAVYAVWVRKPTPTPPLPTPAPAPASQAASAAKRAQQSAATRVDAGPDLRPAAPLDEATLMQQIRDNVKANPPLAEALAREGRRRFPNSPDADERDALLVDALINQQRIGPARDETYYYMDQHPQGRFRQHLFIMTGVSPRPRGP